MKKLVTTVAAVAVLAAAPAMAQKNEGWYAGLGLGFTEIKSEDVKDRATGLGGYLGYQMNPYFAFEGELQMSGEAKDTIEDTTFKGKYNNFGVGVVGMYPIGNVFSVFGRFAAIYGKGEFKIQEGDDPQEKITARDGGYSVGVGAGAQFGPVDIRLRYDYMRVRFNDGDDIDKPNRIGLDVLWRFGDSK